MNQKFLSRKGKLSSSLAGLLLVSSLAVQATPYATCLTNSGTSISFRLNESADNVKIISSSGAVTNELGPVAKGLTITNLAIVGIYKIEVTKNAGPGYLLGTVNQISDDANNFVKFVNQRGVAVNKNTNSPYFGRIYVGVGAPGTTAGRTVGDGIYVLNADQTDAVGQGDTPRTGGMNGGVGFDALAASGESPGRLFVGPDDNLYICDWSDANGGLCVTDANVATNAAATNVLFGLGGPTAVTNIHGSVSSVYVEGSLAGGNLTVYTQDEDLGSRNGVYAYNIGSGPLPYTSPESLVFNYGLAAQLTKITRGPNGYWYCSNRRADNASSSGLFVYSADGQTQLWASLGAWRTFTGNSSAFDILFGECRGFDVSPDGKYLASFRGNTNSVSIVPLENGVPNITNYVVMPTTPTTSIARDLTFDAVGNIYTVSSGQGVLRVYSKGGFSVVTSGSDGTFNVLSPSTTVKIESDTNIVFEAGATVATLTLTRTNDNADFSLPLTVNLGVSGTATRGSDYLLKTNSVTFTGNSVVIPAGVQTLAVSLVCSNDTTAELNETATISVVSSLGYTVGTPGIASVDIVDDEQPVVDLSVTAANAVMFEANSNDYVRLTLTRRGDTNAASYTVNLGYTPSPAVRNTDYVAPDSVTMDPGEVTKTFDISPIDDSLLEGNESFIVTVTSGSGYTPGVSVANPSITDDETPAATVLLSDDLNGDSSVNWTIRHAAGNGIDDYRINDQAVTFPTTAWDYNNDGIPPAPHGADTLGIKLTVNKDEGSAAGAAGINIYRDGVTFSNNYALRFDMYLLVNSGAGTTENAIFGINHSGNNTNWFRASGNGFTNSSYDGIWFLVGADGAALGQFNGGTGSGDYEMLGAGAPVQVGGIWGPPTLARANSSGFTAAFKNPPWGNVISTGPGVPSNLQGSSTPSWAQVEVDQIGNVITLKINNTSILSYTNNSGSQSGKIMLGYDDAFDSNTGVGAAAIYDNIRVVDLGRPTITSTTRAGTSTVLSFSWTLDDPTTAFTIQKATDVAGTYASVAATIVKTGPGTYQATITGESAGAAFYRVRR